MTGFSKSDISHLATLSGLSLTDEEMDSMVRDMTNIVDFVGKLDDLDTDGVEPTYQVVQLENIGQSDEVDMGEVSREQLLELAPAQRDNQIAVPKVL